MTMLANMLSWSWREWAEAVNVSIAMSLSDSEEIRRG